MTSPTAKGKKIHIYNKYNRVDQHPEFRKIFHKQKYIHANRKMVKEYDQAIYKQNKT